MASEFGLIRKSAMDLLTLMLNAEGLSEQQMALGRAVTDYLISHRKYDLGPKEGDTGK